MNHCSHNGRCNTPFYCNQSSSRTRKTSKGIEDVNNTINNLDLIDTYTTQLSAAAEYIEFSSGYRMFTKVGHLLDHKTNLKF